MWRGIVGKSFTPDDLRAYLAGLEVTAWQPTFVVLHNTYQPTLANWHDVSGEQRLTNLAAYYRDQMHWSAGPHLFVADDGIWVFSPLTTPGVHSPSWNHVAFGVEMVGDYDTEPFDSGPGLAVQQHAIKAVAALDERFGFDSATLRLHKEDPQTTHKDCPGSAVDKDYMVQAIHDQLEAWKG